MRLLLLVLSAETYYVTIFLATLTKLLHAIFFEPAKQLG